MQVQVNALPLIVPTNQAVVNRTKTGQVNYILLTFSGALDPITAGNKANYQIISNAGRDKIVGTKDDVLMKIASVTYDVATRTVKIVPLSKFIVPAKSPYLVRAVVLKDTAGRLVDGNRDNTPGSDVLYNLTSTAITLV